MVFVLVALAGAVVWVLYLVRRSRHQSRQASRPANEERA
jgi:hypothetical protein